tara:strand:+ start:483 stop:791 length:309 start_codon:yes stop_codon:yes gene_type:complete
VSPTQRSLKKLREDGYEPVEIVEKYVRTGAGGFRKDLFGFCDLLALHPNGEILCCQTTSRSNVSARVKKIEDHPNLDIVRKCNIRIVVHGWDKDRCREVDLS